MKPRWGKIETEFNLDSEFYDYDERPDIVSKYSIGQTLPVAILVNGEVELHRFIGEVSKKEIIEKIEELQK